MSTTMATRTTTTPPMPTAWPRYRNGLLNVGSDRFKSKTIGVRDPG